MTRLQGRSNQFAYGPIAQRRVVRNCAPAGQEFLRLWAHEDWVVCTLPHDSAMVSKIFSCRNEGFA
jgi:hypothetical protein